MFSRDAKDEIAGVHVQRPCCAQALVRALVLFGSPAPPRQARVRMNSTHASVARAVIAAAHAAGVDAVLDRAPAPGGPARFGVSIPVERARMRSRGAATALARMPQRRCCRRASLRAAFLACGSVSDPVRAHHLELFCHDDAAARMASELIASFGIDAGIVRRRGRPLVYIKHADAVAALLGHMGANQAVLRLASQRAVKQTKNSIRRTVNSEAANAARAASSAARQRKAVARAVASVGLSKMSKALREAAQLRIAYPSRTLRELARAARPPITKAAMASRLRLLERMAER